MKRIVPIISSGFRTPASAQASSDRLRRRPSVGPYLRVAFGEGICGAGSASVRWGSAPRSQTPSVDFHPRAWALAGGFAVPSAPSLRFASAHRGDLPRSSSQLGSNGISPRARFASWRWLSLRLFSLLLRAKCGLSASSGETRRHSSPKRARRSEAGNSCRPNSAAPVFRLAAGVSPSGGQCPCGARRPAGPRWRWVLFLSLMWTTCREATRDKATTAPGAASARPLATASRLGFASGNPTPSARANLAPARPLATASRLGFASGYPRFARRILLAPGLGLRLDSDRDDLCGRENRSPACWTLDGQLNGPLIWRARPPGGFTSAVWISDLRSQISESAARLGREGHARRVVVLEERQVDRGWRNQSGSVPLVQGAAVDFSPPV